MIDSASTSLRLLPAPAPAAPDGLVESYRRLADVFHEILAEQSLDALLDRIADALAELIPYDTLTVFRAEEAQTELVPVLARDKWADKILATRIRFSDGITGWAVTRREAVLVNQAHLDPRVMTVPGTPEDEPEAMISIPLVARDAVKGAMNVYRLGASARFDDAEFELAKRFGDAVALALDNAQTRARLEHQAQTDSLTGLYNHRYFHDRLRSELAVASRSHTTVSVLMVDLDDFKRVNDVYGHGAGDEILRGLAETLRGAVRTSDVVCRLGGEEFAIVMTSHDPESAVRLAERIVSRVSRATFDPIGRITISLGLAQGPEDAMNPRELVACAEAAMMTAKARGKNQFVLYSDDPGERPSDGAPTTRDVRSLAHMKMLQSLSGKLNRLNDVRQIGEVIATELRSLIDYHNCRVFVVEGQDVLPIAFRGKFVSTQEATMEVLACKVGDGITGHVAASGEWFLTGDAANCEFSRRIPGTEVIDESLLAVPLNYGTRVIGVIVLSKLGLDQFDEDDVRLLEVLGGHAAVALENASLYESARREAESATALLQFSRELASAEGMMEVAYRIVTVAAGTIGSSRASLWLQDAPEDELSVRGSHGYGDAERAELEARRCPGDEARELLCGREPFVTPVDVPALGAEAGFALVPLKLDGARHGCISVETPGSGEFAERDLRLLAGIAHQAQLAIVNAISFQNLEETFLSTVEALANALEANDEYTSSHARWITDLSLKVGIGLGLDPRALKRLELGALFHDIGKIGIPGPLLSKPGPLTDEERALMETHPELGERIISPIDRLEEVRPIVRHCHERWDGAGYPDRRAGESIPIESRIIFVCDAYHAMTTDRPYRKRLSHEEAVRRLQQAAGTQFDPDVVSICIDILGEA